MAHVEKYESLEAFCGALNSRPTYKDYVGKEASLMNSKPYISFTGTADYAAADKLMTDGDEESAAKITAATKRIKMQGKATKATVYDSPIGFCPNVPAYLTGNPNNMYNVRKQVYNNSKILSIVVNRAADCTVTADEITEFGAKVLQVVYNLEHSGYRVNLYITICAEFPGVGTSCAVVKIKDSGKPLNVTRVAYPLVHPSMFRRHMFRWIETNGKTIDAKRYGYPSNRDQSIKALHGVIRNALYLGYASDSEKSVDELTEELRKQNGNAF